jgi:hypothetical protein
MIKINKKTPPTTDQIQAFLKNVNFNLPPGFIDFYKETNGADIEKDEKFIFLWELTEMIQLNEDYGVEEYAPDFFIFGSDGGGTAFAINKNAGDIYEMPFIGISKDEAKYIGKIFKAFIENA